MPVIALILVASLLAGCNTMARNRARDEVEQSKETYKTCLAQHAGDTGACQAEFLTYQADLEHFSAMTGAQFSGAAQAGAAADIARAGNAFTNPQRSHNVNVTPYAGYGPPPPP